MVMEYFLTKLNEVKWTNCCFECKKGGLDSTNSKDAMDFFFNQMDLFCFPTKGV